MSRTSHAFTLQRDARQRLVLMDAAGTAHVDVEPVRCFPISGPDQWIAICDAQGRELVRIRDLSELDPALRASLERELAGHEFVPAIVRISEVEEGPEFCQWHVETDRGPISFQANDEGAVRRLDERRVMILDTTGIRYLVMDLAALDKPSQRILERYL
jgi:hypothetical protein